MSKPDWEAIKSACQSGESARSIAERCGVSHTAINKRAKKEGWVKVSSEVSTRKKVSAENQCGNLQAPGAAKPHKKVSTSKKSEKAAKTKCNNRSGNPHPTPRFEQRHTLSVKHGGYARRMRYSDEVTEDARALELRDELILVRSANLTAAEAIGKCKDKLAGADAEEREVLEDRISAAEKAMFRNIARIESLERTLAGMAIDVEMPAKVIADREFRQAATEKSYLESEKLRKELAGDNEDDDPTPVVVSINVVDARKRGEDADDSAEP